LGTKDPKVFFNMGNNYFFLNHYAEAEESLKIAVKVSPGYVEAMVNLGRVYISQKRYVEAEAVYRHATNFDSPHRFVIYMNLAFIYETLGQVDKAIHALKQALSLSPRNPDALQRLARLTTIRDQIGPKNP